VAAIPVHHPNTKKEKKKNKDLERERNITYTRLLPAIRL
jgi:hypothetical protein